MLFIINGTINEINADILEIIMRVKQFVRMTDRLMNDRLMKIWVFFLVDIYNMSEMLTDYLMYYLM